MTFKQLVNLGLSFKREHTKKYKYMADAIDLVIKEFNKRKTKPHWSEDDLISTIAEEFIESVSIPISSQYPELIEIQSCQLKAFNQCTIRYMSIHAIQDLIEHLAEGNSKSEVRAILRESYRNIKLEDFESAWALLYPGQLTIIEDKR